MVGSEGKRENLTEKIIVCSIGLRESAGRLREEAKGEEEICLVFRVDTVQNGRRERKRKERSTKTTIFTYVKKRRVSIVTAKMGT